MIKICTKCKESKEAELHFYRRIDRRKPGFRSHCKACSVRATGNWRKTKHGREYSKNYKKANRRHNEEYKITHALRNRLQKALKSNSKRGSAIRDLGCTVSEFRVYLEALFRPGMSWANYGFRGWHIDHIKPLASFDLTDPAQFRAACHFTNLQPLWAKDNLQKGARISL